MQQEQKTVKADIITDMVIGMSDGFMMPFAVVTGLYRAGVNMTAIICCGLIAAIAGAVTIALGRFYAAKEDTGHDHELHHQQEIFDKIGLDADTQHAIADEMAKEGEEWQEMMQQNALDAGEFETAYVRRSAIYIGVFYALAGIIPVLPFMLISDRHHAWQYTVGITVACLLGFGLFKGKMLGTNAIAGALRVAFMGIAAAGAAYFLGELFV